jgi:hypothetical protein
MNIGKWTIGIVVSITLTAIWYANSVVMTEYEHDLDFPDSTSLVRSDVKWWWPRGEGYNSYLKSVVEMPQTDFIAWVGSLPNCRECQPIHCEVGRRYTLFPVPNADVTNLDVVEITPMGNVMVKISTVYT